MKKLLFVFLFAFCLARLAVHAPYRPFNADEESGLAEAYDYTFVELLAHGPQPELNASPLHYILDRAWLKLTDGAHRHVRMSLLFRLQTLTYFALGCAFAFLLALGLAGTTPPLVAYAFAILASIFFQTSPGLSWSVGLEDRPLSLWVMLSLAQLYFFWRSLERRPAAFDGRLAAVNALLAATTAASGIQVIATFAVRAWPCFRARRWRESRALIAETLPAILLCAWYGVMSSPQIANSTTGATFLGYWLAALENGFWATLTPLHFIGGTQVGETWSGNIIALAAGALLAALPAWSRNVRLRQVYFCCLLIMALSVPLTLISWLWAHSVQARYLYFLYPILGTLHLLGVLAAAELISRRWRRAGGLLLVGWALAQLLIRVPPVLHDTRVALLNKPPIPTFRAEASALCPRELGEVRYGPKGGFHAASIDSLCMLGVKPEPMPVIPGIPTRKNTRVPTFLSPDEKIE